MRRGTIGHHPSAAPPAPTGAGVHSADGHAGPVGGDKAGFTHRRDRLSDTEIGCWDRLVAPSMHAPRIMEDFIDHLDRSPEGRSAALLVALKRARLILNRVSLEAPTSEKVTVSAADLLILTKMAMGRLR